jgi:hypothetical protein
MFSVIKYYINYYNKNTIKLVSVASLISLIIGSSEGGFRSRDERNRAEKKSEI